MAWDTNAVSAMAEYPSVFAPPSVYGSGIAFNDPMTGRHLLFAAEYFAASVETMCISPLTITGARDDAGALEITVRLSVPMTARHLLLVAKFLAASVEKMCIPPLTITSVREVDGALELTMRLAVPSTIDVPSEE